MADVDKNLGIARDAVREGDWAHALRRFADALAIEPSRVEAQDGLRRVAAEIDALSILAGNNYIRHRAHHLPRHRLLRQRSGFRITLGGRPQTRQPEIQHLHVTTIAHHDVIALDIAMRDTCRVGGAQRSRHLTAKRQQGRERIVFRYDGSQRAAEDPFHHDEAPGLALADVVHGDDVGMIESARGFGFMHESSDAAFVLREFRGQELDRDLAVEPCIFGQPDLVHPARTDCGGGAGSIGFAAAALGKRFRLYSIATILIMLVFGALTGLDAPRIAENLPTPWVGVWERINIAGYLLWVVVLAITLLRANGMYHLNWRR